MSPRSLLSVLLLLSYCGGCNRNGPDDQFVTLATIAKMPEDGSAPDDFLFNGEIRSTHELHSDISGLYDGVDINSCS
jgi:hypothetical protein